MNKIAIALAGLSLTVATGAVAQAINPAYEYSSAITGSDGRDFTLGFQFALSGPMTVNALGFSTVGLGQDEQVAIWDAQGNLITSTTVLTTDAVVGHFAWHAIANLALTAGTYTIGGTFEGGGVPVYASGVTYASGYTWLTDEQTPGSGLLFPNFSTGGQYGDNGIAMVNLSFAGGAVPEPASWAMMVGGFALAGAAMRRTRAIARFV
jgi:hypothetical protein